jgi:hypothetical protein
MIDAAIRIATRGIYSHVELISGRAELGAAELCLSASSRDGGVRLKTITLKPAHWDLVCLDLDAELVFCSAQVHIGDGYDFVGILGSQMLPFDWQDPNKWFCSELCAQALGLPKPQRYSPQRLFEVVRGG